MHSTPRVANPFDLLLDPQAVLNRMERCESLSRLQRRVCRPLDKPLLGPVAASGEELANFDQVIEDTSELSAAEESEIQCQDLSGEAQPADGPAADEPR